VKDCTHWTLSTNHIVKWKVVGQMWGTTNPSTRKTWRTTRTKRWAMLNIVCPVVLTNRNNLAYKYLCCTIYSTHNQSNPIYLCYFIYLSFGFYLYLHVSLSLVAKTQNNYIEVTKKLRVDGHYFFLKKENHNWRQSAIHRLNL